MPSPTTSIVNIRVRLFASYAERLGLDSVRVALPDRITIERWRSVSLNLMPADQEITPDTHACR